MQSFLASLKERKIAQWSLSYLAAGWILLQVLGQLAGTFAWDPRLMRIITTLIGVGFLAMLVVAYYHGERGQQRVNATEFSLLLVLLLAGGSTAFMQWQREPADGAAGTTHSAPPKSIAVLPFTSFTHDTQSDGFAAGIQDEILTALAKVGDLKVISRTSVAQYAGTTKTTRIIGQELGVRAVLEGSVQRSGNAVQVQAQLIDASTQEHLWAEKFSGDLSNIFAIQSDIAEKITTSLKARLTSDERTQMTTAPTKVPAAYEAYKTARQFEQRAGLLRENFEAAAAMYKRAIDLDPGFALAYARLSMVQGALHWYSNWVPESRVWQRESADKAIALAPDLPEAHEALGLAAYWLDYDYAKAAREYTIAARGLPGDAEVIARAGYALRRQGDWTGAIKMMERASELDPLASTTWSQLGAAYLRVRRFDDAVRATRMSLEISPDNMNAAGFLDIAALCQTGTLDQMRHDVQDPILSQSPDQTLPYHRFLLAFYSRDVGAGMRFLNEHRRPLVQQDRFVPVGLASGWLRVLGKDMKGARLAFDSARASADSAVRAQPTSAANHLALAFSLAGLGNADAAVREARAAMALKPQSRDALAGPVHEYYAAQVFAQAGLANDALKLLERVYSRPDGPCAAELRIDPGWDALRSQPRFNALLSRKGY